jgi:hypothetical protein
MVQQVHADEAEKGLAKDVSHVARLPLGGFAARHCAGGDSARAAAAAGMTKDKRGRICAGNAPPRAAASTLSCCFHLEVESR